MEKIKLKSNKGISMVDVIIAIIIMAMFVGIVGNLYVKIATDNSKIKMNALATYYVVQIAEYIDKISYDDEFLEIGTRNDETVQNALKGSLKSVFIGWTEDIMEVNVIVKEPTYKNQEIEREDILKQIEIVAEYSVIGEEEKQKYTVFKTKVKEM